jgi:hypothetical protein
MAVTGTAQNATAAALIEPFGIEPFFDAFESYRFVGLVSHGKTHQKLVNV